MQDIPVLMSDLLTTSEKYMYVREMELALTIISSVPKITIHRCIHLNLVARTQGMIDAVAKKKCHNESRFGEKFQKN